MFLPLVLPLVCSLPQGWCSINTISKYNFLSVPSVFLFRTEKSELDPPCSSLLSRSVTVSQCVRDKARQKVNQRRQCHSEITAARPTICWLQTIGWAHRHNVAPSQKLTHLCLSCCQRPCLSSRWELECFGKHITCFIPWRQNRGKGDSTKRLSCVLLSIQFAIVDVIRTDNWATCVD